MSLYQPIPLVKGTRLNKAELSQALRESLTELDKWVRSGCPCERTGGIRSPLMFDLAQVVRWRIITQIERSVGKDAAAVARCEMEREAFRLALADRGVSVPGPSDD